VRVWAGDDGRLLRTLTFLPRHHHYRSARARRAARSVRRLAGPADARTTQRSTTVGRRRSRATSSSESRF